MSSITIHNLKKTYKSVTLTYPNIKILHPKTLLVGENGSGKSTLLYAMMGWIHYQGTIDIPGTVSMMIERPVFPRDVTVRTVLDTLCPTMDDSLLRAYQLQDKLDDMVSSLSKGMKAKLNILQSIGQERDWYLFDEPTSGLDQAAIAIFLSWLEHTDKRWIVSTHQRALFSHLNCEVIALDQTS